MRDKPTIWWLPEDRRFWMEHPTDVCANYEVLRYYERAIAVTNAYEVLDPALIEELRHAQVS